MYDRIDARRFSDLRAPMSRRPAKGVYFVRVDGWRDGLTDELWAYHEAARTRGVILEGQIANPDERQLSYMNEVLGDAFEASESFITAALGKWMPRMKPGNREEYARALVAELDELRRQGKPEGVLRNLYFKLMCWLYYKFERVTPLLGEDDPPRILYECPRITAHELTQLRILNRLGADILLLESAGDGAYLKQDPQSRYSQLLIPADKPFPANFSLKQLRKDMAVQSRPAPEPPPKLDPMTRFPKPTREACTNAWMKAANYNELLTPIASRGDDPKLFYNAFLRVKGVPDKQSYLNDLHQFYKRFKSTGRKIVIVDDGLTTPSPEEIARIRRRNYQTAEEMIIDLANNLPGGSAELRRSMQRAFVEVMTQAQAEQPTLSRLLNAGVYLLCWVQRYHAALFQGSGEGDVPCFILMGGCKTGNDARYLQFLSRIPVDVLILAPDLNRPCALKDERLLEQTGGESMPAPKFPRDAASIQLRTVASFAEDDLTGSLYTGSGLYRDRQFSRAEAMTLQTTYDELFLLWNEELKYRSGFETVNGTVTMPVLYAKVSGVEKGRADAYWQKIKTLVDKDTCFVPNMPMIAPGTPNPYQSMAVSALRGGKLNRAALQAHRQYPFGLLRQSLQDHILDKLQFMLDRRLIRGTFVNGTEYTVVATVLNMDKALLRTLQSFDFTKKNPKLVCIAADDKGASLEDAIMTTFLNLAGFDIVLFVPTGYQSVERYLNDSGPVEHQVGDYLYDLTVPDFNTLPPPKGRSWLDNLFRR